ncbi:hypothetical protein EUTSA_v10011905mg [Eutrema salsugineum]|uniref:Secreted protein n=1 Tax=Eutrema salsugineum TaxID=72664 RepID=V4KUL5_EUTSA|nr:hypothetical protein EUTSA_v10011905mg [Eutrema salsugineum]
MLMFLFRLWCRCRLNSFSFLWQVEIVEEKLQRARDHSRIGRPGFSRVVYCNQPDSPEAADSRNYCIKLTSCLSLLLRLIPL